MFDFDNMASFFGAELATETSKPSKKAGKETKVSVTDADSVDLETSDDSLEESLGDMPAKASAAKGGKSSKVSSPTGETTITLPCRVYARDFMLTVETLEDKSLNGLVAYLVEHGYNEVKSSSVNFLVLNKGAEVYITSPQIVSSSDTLVDVATSPVCVCAGMLQMELTGNEFSNIGADEISVDHVLDKWVSVNGHYKSCTMSYDAASNIAIPIVPGISVKEFKLPFVVSYFGTQTEITAADFLLKETVSAEDLTEHLFPNIKCNVEYKMLNGIVYHEFNTKKGQELAKSINRKKWLKTVNSAKKAVIRYPLPFSIYFVNLGITMPLDASMFDGKTRLTEEEVVDYLKPSYSILRNSDRKVDCFFSEESQTMSIALVSGKKGAYAAEYDEDEDFLEGPGPFKLLHTFAEYLEAIKSDSFLGHFHENGISRRIEATPVATYVGFLGRERECNTVKSVELHLKVPKIPQTLYDTICLDFRMHPMEERIIQICWDSIAKKHILVYPEVAMASKTKIEYQFNHLPSRLKPIITIHSHNTMAPYFSATDNTDEAFTGIYGVVGTVNISPTACFRVGMEGAFSPIAYSDLFEEV